MKVLHIIPTLSTLAGGPTKVALNLVSSLNELGADAEILTTNDDGDGKLDVPLNELIEFKGVPVRFFSRTDPRLKEFIISPSAVRWLYGNMHRYDILDIHYLFSFVPLVARSIARHKKIPYTVRTMGQLSPWALQQSRLKKQIFFKLQEFKNLNEANGLHSTSKGEEHDIRLFGLKGPVINIPLGVDKPTRIEQASQVVRRKHNIDPEAFIILFLSRLHYKKRPEVLIEVTSLLKDKYNIHLIIAGSGDLKFEEELRQLVRAKDVVDLVTFTGFVDGVVKDELLQGSDIFALPSFSENFAIAVAESLAAGTPVVITPEVQISEYIEEYEAGIVAAGTANDFAKAIADCISSKSMIDRFRDNGLRLVEKRFNWKNIGRELLDSYETVLRDRGVKK